jgi:outer membrane immunogenic protein
MSGGYATSDHTHIGWTVGGGVEWAIGANWTLRAEYLYIDLGKMDYAFDGKTAGGQPYDTDHYHADLILHTARIGLNYKFGTK